MDYEGMILAPRTRDIVEDDPDWDPVLTCWCCPEDYNYQNCENCDYRIFKEMINQ